MTSGRGCAHRHRLHYGLTCVPFQETEQLKNKSKPVSAPAPQARPLPAVVNRAKPSVRGLRGGSAQGGGEWRQQDPEAGLLPGSLRTSWPLADTKLDATWDVPGLRKLWACPRGRPTC